MPIPKEKLKKMNEAIAHGSTISKLAEKYPQYDYWEIYWEVNDMSFLGKKRTITNRLNKLKTEKSREKREEWVADAQMLLDELYKDLKKNSKKLIEIDRVLRK